MITKKSESKNKTLSFIPINLKNLIIYNGEVSKYIQFSNKRLKSDYLVSIVHILFMKYFTLSKTDTEVNLFNLSSTILQSNYGRDYNYYMNFLTSNNIINMVSDYCAAKKSRTYSLSIETLSSKIERYESTDKTLIRKQDKNLLFHTPERIDVIVRQKLIKDLYDISIDRTRALEHLFGSERISMEKNTYTIDSISNGFIFYNFDDYGRMHTNFTILKSSIRKECLYIDGERLSEIDISNSQPLFLCVLISKNLSKINDDVEYDFFKRCVTSGELYKYIMDECGLESKKEVKELIYKVFFGRNRNDRENLIFKSLFPSIFKFIKDYKKEFKDYRVLAYDLQRAESDFLFNTFIKDLINNYPDIKMFTVHDSISFQSKYKNVINEILNLHLNKLF